LAVHSGLTGGVTFRFPPFSCSFEFAVAGGQNLLVTALQLILRRDVTDGRMQTNCVVVFDKLGHDSSGVFQGQRRSGTNAFFLEDAMPAFDLAVPLHRQLHLIWTVHAKPFGSRTPFIRSMAASLRW
jgi:hypothetical protein